MEVEWKYSHYPFFCVCFLLTFYHTLCKNNQIGSHKSLSLTLFAIHICIFILPLHATKSYKIDLLIMYFKSVYCMSNHFISTVFSGFTVIV